MAIHTSKSRPFQLINNFPFHTLLIAIYPILYVYSRNLMNIPFRETVRYLLISAVFFIFFADQLPVGAQGLGESRFAQLPDGSPVLLLWTHRQRHRKGAYLISDRSQFNYPGLGLAGYIPGSFLPDCQPACSDPDYPVLQFAQPDPGRFHDFQYCQRRGPSTAN